ncbi:protein translocase subunit SecF [Candidatus Woesearchaeota archaeon]|nr:protein translocase subunit SecF [Candidatus Woesearchaeota archaeon]
MNRREKRQKRFLKKQPKIVDVQTETKKIEKEKDTSNSFYYKHYKKLLIIPFVMLLFGIMIIGINIATTGDFITKGISFTGGTELIITKQGLNAKTIEQKLQQEFPLNDVIVRETTSFGQITGITIESNIIQENQEQVKKFTNKVKELTNPSQGELTENILGAKMGESFFQQLMVGILIALLFMGIVVFLYFRTIIPSAAVILAAISDIIVTIAITDLFGMKIGVAGITALLMLIGYSVDTDILLSSRVLKNKEGTVYKRTIDSMKTGITMTVTTMAAIIVTLIMAHLNSIGELTEIMTIILIGLLVDLINTWLQNASILRWYMERKEKNEQN